MRLVNPTSSVSGRRFPPVAELSLHRQIDGVVRALPGPSGEVILIPEMPSPLGLPDFVALIGAEVWLDERRGNGVAPILSEADCFVLSKLSGRRALSSSSLAMRLGWSNDRVAPILTRLHRAGAVRTSRGGALLLAPGMQPHGTLIAIEAKVKDWNRAVRQGRSYRTWANNYVVLLGDVGHMAAERAREEVATDGAGLVVGSTWLVKPRSRVPSAVRRLLGYEYVLAALASQPAL